jgi:hypothetical protein
MRVFVMFLPLSLAAAPAVAEVLPPPPPPPPVVQLPQVLTDPATADRLDDAVQGLSQALLDMRIGNIQAALQGRRATRAERDMTVGDLARRRDPDFDRHLHQQIAAAKPKVEQSIRALNQALPEINADLDHARRSLERALSNLPDPNYPRR